MPTTAPSQSPPSSLSSALSTFTTSASSFRILHTVSPHSASASKPTLQSPSLSPSSVPTPQILILDSSFNPPTRAHFHLARSALLSLSSPSSLSSPPKSSPAPKRLLLLLATTNADKAPKPAPFDQRLEMMRCFAEDLVESFEPQTGEGKGEGDGEETSVIVDVGVTKQPFFVNKARAVDGSRTYLASSSLPTTSDKSEGSGSSGSIDSHPQIKGEKSQPAQQIHLTGYDTLRRILDTKYYAPSYSLEGLKDLFERHALRVSYRTGDQWGDRQTQEEFVKGLKEGTVEIKGWKREWAERIEMVEGRNEGEEVFSSTEAREKARGGDKGGLERLCTRRVSGWVLGEGRGVYAADEQG